MKLNILKKKWDFEKLYKKGKSVSSGFFVLYYSDNEGDHEIGISVPKKFINAVGRNRTKRRVKEMLRGYDLSKLKNRRVMLIVRKKAIDKDFDKTKKELYNILRKVHNE